MTKTFLALPLALFPTALAAEPGSGTDLYRVQAQVEAMQRDGRWQQLLRAQSQPPVAASGPTSVRAPATPSRSARPRRPR
jgi:hypothetical protein